MWIKRMIAGAISLALLVTALISSYEVPAVNVGKGKGKGAEIHSIEDMSNVLRSVEALGSEQNIISLSFNSASALPRHSSVTMTESTNMTLDSSYSRSSESSSQSGSSSTSFRRKLQIAFAQDAAYYVSDGQLISRSDSSQTMQRYNYDPEINDSIRYSLKTERESKNFLDFSVNVYISPAYVLLKINRLEYNAYQYYKYTNSMDSSENEEEETWGDDILGVLQGYLGEWIDCTSAPEIAEIFLTVNDYNIETIGLISDFLEDALNREENIFHSESGHYTLDEDGLKQLFGISEDQEEDIVNFDGMFDINLSSAASPSIKLDMSSSVVNNSAPSASVYERNSTDINIQEVLFFKDIDNTVIELSRDLDTVDILEIVGEEIDG